METKAQAQNQSQSSMNNNRSNVNNNWSNMKRSSSSNSDAHTHLDSPHSPLRFHSPLRSDKGDPDPPDSPSYFSPHTSPQKSPKNPTPEKQHQQQQQNNSKAIVAVPDKFPRLSPAAIQAEQQPPPDTGMTLNRAVKGEGTPSMTKVGPGAEGRSGGAVSAILKRSRTEESVKVANLGFRLSEIILCLISFSVMAADKTQGWSGDSFDRYREYRYCLSINVIGFVYSAFQAYDLGYYISTGKHVIRHHLRRPFDFFMDQVLAYLLISAASAAATRVDDWQSNWGKDDFTVMASASIAMAFLAFVAFAFSSLITGYSLCTTDAM